MTTKEKVMQAVQALPEDASIEDAMEKLYFLAKIEKGLEEANAGQTVTHHEVKARMARWLK
jgi:predicted transcriptional regulator